MAFHAHQPGTKYLKFLDASKSIGFFAEVSEIS